MILELLKQYRPKVIKIDDAVSVKPPPNFCWVILAGAIQHINGSDSDLIAYLTDSKVDSDIYFITGVDADEATDILPLFGGGEKHGSAWCPVVIEEPSILYFNGGVGSFARVQVIEFPALKTKQREVTS